MFTQGLAEFGPGLEQIIQSLHIIALAVIETLFGLCHFEAGAHAFAVFYLGGLVNTVGQRHVALLAFKSLFGTGIVGPGGVYFELNGSLQVVALNFSQLQIEACPVDLGLLVKAIENGNELEWLLRLWLEKITVPVA